MRFSHWQLVGGDPYEEGSASNKIITEIRERKGLKGGMPNFSVRSLAKLYDHVRKMYIRPKIAHRFQFSGQIYTYYHTYYPQLPVPRVFGSQSINNCKILMWRAEKYILYKHFNFWVELIAPLQLGVVLVEYWLRCSLVFASAVREWAHVFARTSFFVINQRRRASVY